MVLRFSNWANWVVEQGQRWRDLFVGRSHQASWPIDYCIRGPHTLRCHFYVNKTKINVNKPLKGHDIFFHLNANFTLMLTLDKEASASGGLRPPDPLRYRGSAPGPIWETRVSQDPCYVPQPWRRIDAYIVGMKAAISWSHRGGRISSQPSIRTILLLSCYISSRVGLL